jgi:hypothetical protein
MNNIYFKIQTLLITILICSCLRDSPAQCEASVTTKTVSIGDDTIKYNIDSVYIDISNSLEIENWGPLAIKRYVNNGDTLTIRWYHGYGRFNDAEAIRITNNYINKDSFYSCIPVQKKQLFENIHGISSEVNCKEHFKIVFFGVNPTTDITILLEYTSCHNKINDIECFFQVIKSMTFKQISKY